MGSEMCIRDRFRTGYITDGLVAEASVVNVDINDYDTALTLLGTGPVDYAGNMGGVPYQGFGNAVSIEQYKTDLQAARDILRDAYGFTQDQASTW